jgi:precorrin-6Y C5,15-methyltransferase (decarboxylating)
MTAQETASPMENNSEAPWLSLVGIGDDGIEGIGKSAREAISQAEMFIGGERHLAFLPEDGRPRVPWPSPLSDLIDQIPGYRGKKLCVLTTGDPFFFGIGAILAEKIPIEEMKVYPAPSSFNLALSRLGWSLPGVRAISLHGRPLRSLLPHLVDKARLAILTANRNSPGEIAGLLEAEGFGGSILHVFSHLGGKGETHVTLTARELASAQPDDRIQDLNIVAVELAAEGHGLSGHLLPGLEEGRFRHDGQITKREIRILTLAALMPKPGDLLWDVGAGSGSVSIEWLRADPSLEAIAVEKSKARLENLRANAEALGTPRLRAVQGEAPGCLTELSDPDTVFIGGGLRDESLIESCWPRLKPGGRLVANAVTLEGEAALQRFFGAHGGDLVRLQVSRLHTTGRLHGWRPGTPITQFRIAKP